MPELPDPSTNSSAWIGLDGPTLLSAASALQLDPNNVPWLLSLQRLAAVAASLPPARDARPLSTSRMKSLLSLDSIGGPTAIGMQDPFEGLFAVEVPFYGGPRLTVQGLATHSGWVADFLLNAIFRAEKGSLPGTFLVKVRALANLLLTVSDRVCRRAGLDRWSVASDSSRRINMPSAKSLADMTSWVKFEENDLFEGLPDLARQYLITGLVHEQGDPPPADADASDWYSVKPFVRNGSTIVAAAPTELTAALRHHIVRAAIEEHCVSELVAAMLSFASEKVEELLRPLVDDPLVVVAKDQNWTRLRAQFDLDKTMDVFVVVDDLRNYDPYSVFGAWDASKVFETIENEAQDAQGDRILRIYSTATLGRDLSVGVGSSDDTTPVLFAPMDDLRTILETPGFGGLDLWYFARAERKLSEHTRFLSFSTVDTFSIYLDHERSFYLSDGPRPSFLHIEVASGQELRVENSHRLDRRLFAIPDGTGYVDALAAHGALSSPIYLALLPDGAAYVVDLDTCTAWIRVPRLDSLAKPSPISLLLVVAESLAYWIWQVWKVEPELLQSLAAESGVIEFFVVSALADSSDTPWICAKRNEKNIRFEVSTRRVPPSESNEADRELVIALGQVLGAPDDNLVDRVAPRGPKGMMHVSNSHETSAWSDEDGAVWRGAEEAVSELLDQLGEHLTTALQMPQGPVADDQRFRLLTSTVVPWLIDRLRDEITELDPAGLLELLINRNEALIAASAREKELLAPRIACFGAADDEVQQIQRRLSIASSSMMASRFLIEFVSAFPPSGSQRLNRERYDRLLALGTEIINKGMLADSLRSDISDVHFSILESGRLGTSREGDSYLEALEMFSRSRAETVLADASKADVQEAAAYPDVEAADDIAAESYGFSFTELFKAAGVLVDLLENKQTLTTSRDRLREAIAEALDWNADKIDTLLDALSISEFPGPMSEFWKDGVSVAPWRFNRDRSYLKRPLVRRDDQVSFGRRALVHSSVYWVDQFRSGRLRATGTLAAAMNDRRRSKGREFESTVASCLRDLGYSPVRERVRRIANHDFRNIGGEDLGDIDVAATHLVRRELLLVEAKSLEVARTPVELRNEVQQLVGPGNSAVRRLQQRAAWVASHLAVVLAEFGVSDPRGWSIRKAVVVNQPLVSEHLLDESIPVISIERLGVHLATPESSKKLRPTARGAR